MTLPLPRIKAWQLLALCAALAISCSDDSPAASKRPLLVGKTWQVVYYEINGRNVTDEREACETDDTTNFYTDGSLTDNIGGTPCEESDKDILGTWEFKANETILSLRPAGDTASDWNLVRLTENSLTLSQYAQALDLEIVVVMAPL